MAGLLVMALSATAFNVSHIVQLPLILGLQIYLIYRYHGLAKEGQKHPLYLQSCAAVLILWYPMKEFILTEVTKGLQQEPITGVPKPGLQHWSEHLDMLITQGAGIALTVAAAWIAGGVQSTPEEKSADAEPLLKEA
eukprot:gnl/MRDRNA2_/MRDRNA2_168714_c0_seq1.p1 gnl/MRDRNA2_/MRDRNA2_168714_c0~~gnl/MRDRNA2_/MRDRNA2_168714_c0_seq1.p1  ORF type:complete len:137 (-),score=24.91 gnl/MRDRNA2_/MRDRNA2_168714_c0_seq1:26-436(-)